MIRSVNGTPRLKRKRLRSVTPSDGGHANGNDERSPLAKRKKLAAERSGFSRLKEGITADELAETASNGSAHASPKLPMEESVDEEYEDSDDDDDEVVEDVEEEDDFLARDFQDWG